MITIHITDRDDKIYSIEAPVDIDLNLMELAKANDLPVEGTCGGMALCASCHMYIISDHELKEPTDDEIIMLDQAFFVKENSRLGCQIKLSEKLDGLAVKLAPVG
jgi:ferredoxin-2, mitochondrial